MTKAKRKYVPDALNGNHDTENFTVNILITGWEDKMGYISFMSKTNPEHRGHFQCIGANYRCYVRKEGKVPNEVIDYLRSIGFTIPKTFNSARFLSTRETDVADHLEKKLQEFRKLYGDGRTVRITFYNGVEEELGKRHKLMPHKRVVQVLEIINLPQVGHQILKSGKLSQWFRDFINPACKETNWFTLKDSSDSSLAVHSLR